MIIRFSFSGPEARYLGKVAAKHGISAHRAAKAILTDVLRREMAEIERSRVRAEVREEVLREYNLPPGK